MRLDGFEIGKTFRCDGRLWRCTDVGTRVVAAIRLDEVRVGGTASDRPPDQQEAEAEAGSGGHPTPSRKPSSTSTIRKAASLPSPRLRRARR
jgi:hypothetical protein